MKKVQFKQWLCDVNKLNYGENDAIALTLTNPEDGPIATATVCIPDLPLPTKDHTWIKTWSENEGMLEALVEAGIVEDEGVELQMNEFGSMAKLVKVLI